MPGNIVDLMRPENNFDHQSGYFNCYACGKRLNIKDEIDKMHMVARYDGGDCSTDNLAPGCIQCNRASKTINAIDVRAIKCPS